MNVSDQVAEWFDVEARATDAAIYAATGVSSMLALRLLETGWKRARGKEVPGDTRTDEFDLKDAVVWALVSGAVLGATRVLARYGASLAVEQLQSGTRSKRG